MMKQRNPLNFLIIALALEFASPVGFAQTVHRINGVRGEPGGIISLSLTGSVSQPFNPYFDSYLLDGSTNLEHWTPLPPLLGTNALPAPLFFRDGAASNYRARFYRIATNHLITPFPAPTGPYRVGMVSRLMTDPSRTNRYDIATNSSFMISIWYPAQAPAGLRPGRWLDAAIATHVSWQGYTDRVPYLTTHALPAAAVAPDQTAYPVVFYSIGLGGVRAETQDQAEELASHGYIVVGMDHVDCMISVFPNGTVVYSGHVVSFEDLFRSRREDARFVLDQLAGMNQTDPLLAGRMDLQRVGIYGHSNGGVTAAEVCLHDDRFRAAVLLDGYVSYATSPTNVLRQFGLQKPFLAMFNTEGSGDTLLLSLSQSNGFSCQILPSIHNTFSSRLSVTDPTQSYREASRTIRALLRSFFDKYLKGQDDHVLDAPSIHYPMVTNFQTSAAFGPAPGLP
jgi:dienelactone hydrolase